MGLACLNGRPPRFRQWVYIIDPWSDDSTSVLPHLIYSHSLECTRVPWESLTSMVISLTLVNGLHHWPVIKWFLPCSTSGHLFTWLDSYYIGISKKTLGWVITMICTFPRLWWSFSWTMTHILSHRSTLYWFMAMSFHLGDPQCIFHGYDHFMSWKYRSTLYIWWLYSLLI